MKHEFWHNVRNLTGFKNLLGFESINYEDDIVTKPHLVWTHEYDKNTL